jgi:uncharacterized protein (TIGR02217 family)
MAFFEQQLPPCYSFGARGGPVWSTVVAKTQGGSRYVNQNWSAPLHRWNISHAVKTNDDFEAVRAFFYVVAGRFDGFRFKDWSDFEATILNTRLTERPGSPGEWQMQRLYTVGSRTYVRDIYKPVAGAVIWRYRSAVWSAISAGIDYATGGAQFSGHLGGDVYGWVGTFDVPVAFASDTMEAEVVDRAGDDLLVRWPSLEVEEIRIDVS